MKCKFFRLIYPKSIEDAQSGSYTVALYAPCEAVLDAQGNKLSSITVVGYYLPIVEQMKVDMTGRWKKDAKYGLQFMMDAYEEIIDPGKKGIVTCPPGLSVALVKSWLSASITPSGMTL